MKVIFDKKKTMSHGDKNDPDNTPKKLVERWRADLTKMGKFMAADSIEFRDEGKSQLYIITKKGKKLTLAAYGNRFDGGYLVIDP